MKLTLEVYKVCFELKQKQGLGSMWQQHQAVCFALGPMKGMALTKEGLDLILSLLSADCSAMALGTEEFLKVHSGALCTSSPSSSFMIR